MPLKKLLLAVLLVLCGTSALLHTTYYQTALATGDHGRDLYAFAATANGDAPYRDYWWVYGPAMPYYYAGLMHLFGVSIPTVLWGKLLLNVTAGVFFFFTLQLLVPLIPAFLGTMWFWLFRPEFFFTYNHIGGIACLLAETYYLCAYFKTGRVSKLYGALAAAGLLCLVKINFGVAGYVMMGLGVALSDWLEQRRMTKDKQVWMVAACCSVPPIVALIYGGLIAGLPLYELRQCFPFLSADHPHNAPPLESLRLLIFAIWHNINVNWANRIFAALIVVSTMRVGHNITRRKFSPEDRRRLLLTAGFLAVFYVIALTEFLLSGVLYRSYWTAPFSLLLMFLMIGTAFQNVERVVRLLLYSVLLLILFSRFTGQIDLVNYLNARGEQHLRGPRAGVVVANPDAWFETVHQTTEYLQRTLLPGETFFALPYDPLYYYLTERPSPTRQLIFFEHINIPPEQERSVIAELEANQVNYVLLSSRMNSAEPGLGEFGRTYCPVLGRYIFDNFEPVFQTGDWTNPPGWNSQHGTMVLKRKW